MLLLLRNFPAEFSLHDSISRNINMKASKFLIPTAATLAFASMIGIAYAQTGTTGTQYNRSNTGTNADATLTQNRDSTGTMNRDATGSTNQGTTGTMNRDSTGNMNRDTTGAMQRNSPSTTNRDSTGSMNRSSTDDRSSQRLARADRN